MQPIVLKKMVSKNVSFELCEYKWLHSSAIILVLGKWFLQKILICEDMCDININ